MAETIRISEDLADALDERSRPEESYEDVVRRLLEEAAADDEREGVSGRTSPAAEVDDPVARLVNDVAVEALPGDRATAEQRREALGAAIEYLREHETATRADFERDVYPKHPLGFSDEGERSWWDEAIAEGLAGVAERSNVIERTDGGWTYRGDRDG